MSDYEDMTLEAERRRDQAMASMSPEYRRLYGCSIARFSPNIRCEKIDGHEGPCGYVHKGTWRYNRAADNGGDSRG